MTTTVERSNVYYLPTEPVAAPRRPRSHRERFGLRLTRAWWRLRITVAEMRAAVRRPRLPALSAEAVAFLERASPPRSRFATPARVIDFASARARRRPSADA